MPGSPFSIRKHVNSLLSSVLRETKANDVVEPGRGLIYYRKDGNVKHRVLLLGCSSFRQGSEALRNDSQDAAELREACGFIDSSTQRGISRRTAGPAIISSFHSLRRRFSQVFPPEGDTAPL